MCAEPPCTAGQPIGGKAAKNEPACGGAEAECHHDGHILSWASGLPLPGFPAFWIAETVSSFGTAIAALRPLRFP
jgi:hypothetical protein